MRKFFLLFGCVIFAVSCIDHDYDFGQISVDNIAIGDKNSEFKLPLALIRIGTDEISGNNSDLNTFFHEADIWLCDPLPDGAVSIDIARVQSDTDYFDALTLGLVEQMMTDDEKMDAVTGLIFDKYRHEFDIPALPTDIADKEMYQAAFREVFRSDTGSIRNQLTEQVRATSLEYLSKLEYIKPMTYDIGKIDLDSDILDMIIGPAGDEDTVVTLYGTIESHLPALLHIRPEFLATTIIFEVNVTPEQENSFEAVTITKRDLLQLVDNAQITIPITLRAYAPRTFDPSRKEQIVMRLSMHKHGGLNFDL